MNNPEVYKTALQIVDEGFKSAGIEGDLPFKILKEGLNADIVKMDSYGKTELSRVPDMPTRHKYMLTAMQLKRLLDNKVEEVKSTTITHKIAPEDIDRLEKIAAELRGLENRLVNDRVQQGVIDV